MAHHNFINDMQRGRDRLVRRLQCIRIDLEKKGRVKCISEDDFKKGPLIVDSPVVIKLKGNIRMEPCKDNDFQLKTSDDRHDDPPFSLGMFAGIIVKSKYVFIDLCGYYLGMSELFALEQRFFSVIELASTPFIPGQGPGNFGDSIESGSWCMVYNGTIGRSSHHGVHGNGATNLAFENLCVKDFEVAAISLNGAECLSLDGISIGSTWKEVKVLGNYSSARVLPQFFYQIKSKCTDLEWELLNGKLQALLKVTRSVRKEFEQTGNVTNPLFANSSGLPDGNAYNILLHPIGMAINDFIEEDFKEELSKNIYLHNVTATDTLVNAREIVGLSQKGGKDIQVDPSGSVFQITKLTDSNGKYCGNVLSDAQIYLAAMALKKNINIGKLNITQDVVDWAKNGHPIKWLLDKGYEYKCNGDSMHHVSKAVHGYRFDGIKNLVIQDCSLRCVSNVGLMGEEIAGSYVTSHDQQYRPGYRGADTVGWNFSHVRNALIINTVTKYITSHNGNAIGYRFINGCRDVCIDNYEITSVKTGYNKKDNKWYGLDSNNNEVVYDCNYPNTVPNAVGIMIEDRNCNVDIGHGHINGLDAPGCTVPIWQQSC